MQRKAYCMESNWTRYTVRKTLNPWGVGRDGGIYPGAGSNRSVDIQWERRTEGKKVGQAEAWADLPGYCKAAGVGKWRRSRRTLGFLEPFIQLGLRLLQLYENLVCYGDCQVCAANRVLRRSLGLVKDAVRFVCAFCWFGRWWRAGGRDVGFMSRFVAYHSLTELEYRG